MKNAIADLNLLPVEPGEFPFSFTHALASSLNRMGCPLDRKFITGASGFAFRIWAEVKTQCPSAMSIFDFELLKKAVELCGYSCSHISRLWHEAHLEAERRELAKQAIRTAVDEGRAPVVWGIGIPEWGLIAGYDDDAQIYETINCLGQRGEMPYTQLGQGEVPILAVTIPGKPGGKSVRNLARETLQAAVNHARGREWENRPDYENGLAAYPVWAALIKNVDQTGFSSQYYVGTYTHFRDCAATYLAALASEDSRMLPAAEKYASVAAHLKDARDARIDPAFPSPVLLDRMERYILQAFKEETAGVALLEELLENFS